MVRVVVRRNPPGAAAALLAFLPCVDVNGDAESTHSVWSFGGVADGGGGFEEPDGSSFRGVARGGLPGVWRFARSRCSGLIGRS